jgi:16S rRNA (cytosine1402-N4)-methyltransferase
MSTRGRAADRHIPVLRDRILDLLAPALQEQGSVYVDATLGMGGHAEAVLERCPNARVVGIDRDPEALALAGERLEPYAARVTLVHAVYDEFATVLADLGLPKVQAALFDLGVSSLQLDEKERGFSYSQDAPLDMRMDQSRGITAADVLNTYDAAELERVLREYGEERFARRIAAAIVREREREPFTTSGRLVELLKQTVPAASQKSGGHPGKRTFQALRIEVNEELSAWATALPAAIDTLAVGGRLAVLSYHSLEDRITKRVFARGARSSAPEGLPVELPEHAAYLRLLTRGAEEPSAEEKAANPRSASARLRVAERTRSTKGQHR